MQGRGFVVASVVVCGACGAASDRIESGPPGERSVTAMVAVRDLAPGRAIEEADLYAKLVPDNYLPRGVYLDPSEVVGRTPRTRILAHESLRSDAMVRPDDAVVPADRIPEGLRAIEVPTWGATPTVGHLVDAWWSPAGRPCTLIQAVPVHSVRGDRAQLLVSPRDVLRVAALSRQPTFRLTPRAEGDREPRPQTACTR